MTSASLTRLILAVDDEVLVLDLLQSTLEDGGFEVLTAMSADEAVGLLEEQSDSVSALVTDVNLGLGPSGWDVARRAREVNPTLPVIYVSGDSAHEWTVKGVPKSLILQKPFAPAQLVTAVASLLNDAEPAVGP